MTSLPDYPLGALDLPAMGNWPESRHVFDKRQIAALRAAEAAGRPLLVRGDPGTGKSQLAHAAAAATGRLFLSVVVDARAESTDLMWRFDAVARLADAHVPGKSADDLHIQRYVEPGPLWWAYDFAGARTQTEQLFVKGVVPPCHDNAWTPRRGTVLLIDEIDKAEADLPNGLLEALGNGQFAVPLLGRLVRRAPDAPSPLVIITSNDERELPPAFLRRCLVLTLRLPEGEALRTHLMDRGKVHFPALFAQPDGLGEKAADMLMSDRLRAKEAGSYTAGLAEYLDLLRVLDRLGDEASDQFDLLREFVCAKQAPT